MPTTLGGRYRLDDLIGGGGMGEVWRAHDEVLDRTVAIKIIRQHLADDENIRARLRVEAQLAGSLHHPGIVDVFDYGEDEEDGRTVPFLVMPLIDGAPLSMLLSERKTLSPGETMAVVSEVSAALQVAHDAGIVHRDLKPGNILVTPDGRVMLVDFGIAHGAGGEPLTQTGALVGTADFLSPEQAAGRSATARSDLYSLGVVAYTCLTGNLPFHRDSDVATALAHLQAETPDLPETVPAAAMDLVNGLLAKDPSDRPASATAVALAAAALATAVPPPPGHAPDLGGEPTMPDVAATPESTLPGVVERPMPVGEAATVITPASDVPPAAPADTPTDTPAGSSVVAAEHAGRGRSRRIVLLSSVLLVLVASALGWVLLGGSDTVVVPDLVGSTEAAARAQLKAKDLTFESSSVDVAGRKKGEIVDQDPGAGDEVDKGFVIKVSVATGLVPVPVDDLIGTTYDKAVARLDKLGLKAERVDVPSDKETGTVLEVDPTKPVKPGTKITLTVAYRTVVTDGGDEGENKDKDDGKGKDKKGKGSTDPTVEPTEPSPDPSTPTTATPTPAD